MKLVQINALCSSGSTGKICVSISKLLTEKGIENYIFYSLENSDYPLGKKYTDKKAVKFQALKSRVFGNYGFNSKKTTNRLVASLDAIKPDIVHLHNLHSHDCNLEILFKYLKKTGVKVYWTFHDCWAFTGYCPHFDMVGCDKWKTKCHHCIQRKEYSWFFDKSAKLYEKKKELFTGLDMTIITPSKWLAEMVEQSFLKDYDIKVINNGIDLDVFKPTESDFRDKYGIEDKYLILGVAFGWNERKGLDCFVELSKRLPSNYQIVLVGTNDAVDKKIPSNIISIHRTQNQSELAEIYTAADLLVNCTREENYPTVNMESLACGTPVLTFRTGGSPEIIDETCGCAVDKNDIEALEREITRICSEKPYSRKACLNKAAGFEEKQKFEEYCKLYNNHELK